MIFKILKKGTLPLGHVSSENKILWQANIDEEIGVVIIKIHGFEERKLRKKKRFDGHNSMSISSSILTYNGILFSETWSKGRVAFKKILLLNAYAFKRHLYIYVYCERERKRERERERERESVCVRVCMCVCER